MPYFALPGDLRLIYTRRGEKVRMGIQPMNTCFQKRRRRSAVVVRHREELDREDAEAIKEGRAVSGKGKTIQERIAAIKAVSASKAISIRVSEEDLAMARDLADRKGLPYQTCIKSLLHEALQRESKAPR